LQCQTTNCTFTKCARPKIIATIDLISGYAKVRSQSQDAVIRGYDETGNVIETREHKGDSRSALAI